MAVYGDQIEFWVCFGNSADLKSNKPEVDIFFLSIYTAAPSCDSYAQVSFLKTWRNGWKS